MLAKNSYFPHMPRCCANDILPWWKNCQCSNWRCSREAPGVEPQESIRASLINVDPRSSFLTSWAVHHVKMHCGVLRCVCILLGQLSKRIIAKKNISGRYRAIESVIEHKLCAMCFFYSIMLFPSNFPSLTRGAMRLYGSWISGTATTSNHDSPT